MVYLNAAVYPEVRHVAFVAFAVRVHETLAFASIAVLALVRVYSSDELSSFFLVPAKHKTFFICKKKKQTRPKLKIEQKSKKKKLLSIHHFEFVSVQN